MTFRFLPAGDGPISRKTALLSLFGWGILPGVAAGLLAVGLLTTGIVLGYSDHRTFPSFESSATWLFSWMLVLGGIAAAGCAVALVVTIKGTWRITRRINAMLLSPLAHAPLRIGFILSFLFAGVLLTEFRHGAPLIRSALLSIFTSLLFPLLLLCLGRTTATTSDSETPT